MNRLPLATPILGLPGVGPGFLNRLKKLGIETVKDILWHFPARYEDFSQIYKIADLQPGQHATIQGTIEDIKTERTWRRRMTIVEAIIADESGSIRAVWFNQPYMTTSLRVGRVANFAGKVSLSQEGEVYLSHPAYEPINRGYVQIDADHQRSSMSKPAFIGETKHTARLVPIYPETRGLTSKGIRFLVQPVLKNLEELQEWLPKKILEANSFPEINAALNDIHFPEEIENALTAKRRFAFEDLFLLQLYNFRQKLKLAREKSWAIHTDIAHLKNLIAGLPFELTVSQKKSLWEIIQNLEKSRPMNRLLQGDVGSGKTVVAALAAIITAENGLQTAFMAPTEVLARQHFETLKKLFAKISPAHQPSVGLLTASAAKILHETDAEENAKKEDVCKKLENGEVKIAIGTHALIQRSVTFEKLGLVIVDEQHRFGVKQRAALVQRESASDPRQSALVPHFLSMSATPIPRTLMMTVFGDLDISTITELPIGRKEIITKIVPPTKRKDAYDFIREQVKSGRQVFVICPRIEPSQTGADSDSRTGADSREFTKSPRQSAMLWDVKSVKEEYEKLSKKVFPDLKVAMLHGKLKPKEKEKIMGDFRGGKTDILVSTSVIEVGVDIPNATIMMIEGADRFGLAQIYQFRGRVGRGEYQSYCFLFTDSSSKSTAQRLKAILEAKNGFELAERDLKIRGPGEFLGEVQAGMPDYAMHALQDIELVKSSREAAAQVLKSDTSLQKHPALKARIVEFEKALHLE